MRALGIGPLCVLAICCLAAPVMAQAAPAPTQDRSEEEEDEGEGSDDQADEDEDAPPPPLPTLTAGGHILVAADPLFEGNSPELSRRAYELTNSVREAMLGFTGKVRVTVHWSPGSDPKWTLGRTERRAEALADAIRGIGIPADRVVAVGAGSDRPITSNSTLEGQARNRRVEIVSESSATGKAKVQPPPAPTPPARRRPAAATTPAGRLDAKLDEILAMAERFRAATRPGRRDCAAVSRDIVAWTRADGAGCARLDDEITHMSDHELDYQYTASHRRLMKRYQTLMEGGVGDLEACGDADGLSAAAVTAIEGLEVVTQILYEPSKRNRDPFCRRLDEIESDVRDGPDRLKGAPVTGGFASKRSLPDGDCEYSGSGVICSYARTSDQTAALTRYEQLETRLAACHFGRDENEMDQLHHAGGARLQRVWHHIGYVDVSGVTCRLRLVAFGADDYGVVVIIDRPRF